MRVAFIGLGVMGTPMAANLLEAGHQLNLYRVDPKRHQGLLDAGGRAADSVADAVAGVDAVILMVPDTPNVEDALFGEQSVTDALAPGTLVIDMSSISPTATSEFADRIAALGGRYLDAPVSGGQVGAEEGTLSIMIGGSDSDVVRARPLFEVLGENISHVGAVGAGQTAKVANQIIVGLTIEAVAEAITFVEKAGVDPARVRSALMGGFASSRVLEKHGDRMIHGSFEPGFRLDLHRKDLNLALDAATDLAISLPGTALTAQLMNSAVANGDGDLDHSALLNTVRRLSDVNEDGEDLLDRLRHHTRDGDDAQR